MTQPAASPSKSGRGGKRPGAGRKKKGHVPTSPSAVAGVDLALALSAEPPVEIEGVAQRHARTMLDGLVKQLIAGTSETARISAANAVLDRAFGKPAVDVGGETLPLFGIAPDRSVSLEIRSEARRHALLAIEVLRKIAENGASETSRVSAAKSLLDRALGTVAPAKVPAEVYTPLGKKEEAARAAKAAATGRYATPAPPRASRAPAGSPIQ
jgi:hypothetical protein